MGPLGRTELVVGVRKLEEQGRRSELDGTRPRSGARELGAGLGGQDPVRDETLDRVYHARESPVSLRNHLAHLNVSSALSVVPSRGRLLFGHQHPSQPAGAHRLHRPTDSRAILLGRASGSGRGLGAGYGEAPTSLPSVTNTSGPSHPSIPRGCLTN